MNTNSVQLDSTNNLLGFSANLSPTQNITGSGKFDQVFREVSQKSQTSPQEPKNVTSKNKPLKKATSVKREDSAKGQVQPSVAEQNARKADQAVSAKQENADAEDSELTAKADSAGMEEENLSEAQLPSNGETDPTDAQEAAAALNQGIVLAAGMMDVLNNALPENSVEIVANTEWNGGVMNPLLMESGKAGVSAEKINSLQEFNAQDVLTGSPQVQKEAILPENNANQALPEVLSSPLHPEIMAALGKDAASVSSKQEVINFENPIPQKDAVPSLPAGKADSQNQAPHPLEAVLKTPKVQAKADSEPVVNISPKVMDTKIQETPLATATAQSPGKEILKAEQKVDSVKDVSSPKQKSLDPSAKQVLAESPFSKNPEGENPDGKSFFSNALKQPEKIYKALDHETGKSEFQSLMPSENMGNQAVDASQTTNPLNATSGVGEIQRGDFKALHHSEKIGMKDEMKPHEVFERSVVDQVISKASLISRNGQSEMHIRLDPPSLGTIKVHVFVSGENVTAKLVADNSIARDILEKNIHQLRESFNEQGLKVGQMSVHVGNDPRQQAADHFRPFYMEKGFSRPNSSEAEESGQMNQPALSGNSTGYNGKGGISVFA